MSTNEKEIIDHSMEDLWNVWFSELHKGVVGTTVKIKSCIASMESPFQRIDVLDTYHFGKMMVLYGSIMVTEKDEFFYHEMISHVPLFSHKNPKNVLIIGGGDGGTLREVLRHPTVEKVVMCEIDKMVVDVSRKYFPTIGTEFDNPKAKLTFEDGLKFVAESKDKYDVIIVDGADPIGPAVNLFKKQFFTDCFKCLNDDGIFITQSESPMVHKEHITPIYETLLPIFPKVKLYHTTVPTYPGIVWSFAYCSKKYDPIKDFRKDDAKKISNKLKCYNEDVHTASFVLPNYMKEMLPSKCYE